jgi:hypothetical protein
MLSEFLGPSATVFAALFSGTVGLLLGSRLQLGRFKHERAFERRVAWYERLVRCIQQMREVNWEIVSTLTKLPPKRYTELSIRAKELAREFKEIGAERFYAKAPTEEAIRQLGLSVFSLEGNIPAQQTERRASGFWQEQHNQWSKAFHVITDDLHTELFRKNRSMWRVLLRSSRDEQKMRAAPKTSTKQSTTPSNRTWFLRSRNSAVSPETSSTANSTAKEQPVEQLAESAELEEVVAKVFFDSLWATILLRTQLETASDTSRTVILNAVQCGLLRVADLQSLSSMMNRLRDSPRYTAGWQRQHIGRLMSLTLSENAEQFTYILDNELREHVIKIGGAESGQVFDKLLRELRAFRSQNTIKLQSFRNSVIASRYANANLQIQALQRVPISEIETLCLEQVGWITELVNFVTRVLKQPNE